MAQWAPGADSHYPTAIAHILAYCLEAAKSEAAILTRHTKNTSALIYYRVTLKEF